VDTWDCPAGTDNRARLTRRGEPGPVDGTGAPPGVLVAEDRAQPLRCGLTLRSRRGAVRGRLERLELLAEVGLQPGAVLALERAEVLYVAVELVPLPLQVAEHLLAALGGLAVEHLGPTTGVGLEPVGLVLGLGVESLGLRAGLAHGLVGLALGFVDELVGVPGGDLE